VFGTMSGVAESTPTEAPTVVVEHVGPDEPAEGSGVTALLTLRDPRRRNAMSRALSDRLVEALAAVTDDESVHAVVVTGAADRGPAFCAGGDLGELAAIGETLGAATPGSEGEQAIKAVYAGFLALAACPLPTFAAVDGPAVGAGINVALAADVRLAGDTARFEPGFLRLGLHPGGGMTWMTQRLVGQQTTLAMLLAGEGMDAAAAARSGLALRHVPGELPETAVDHEGRVTRSPVVAEALRMAGHSAQAPRDLVVATKASVRATSALGTQTEAVDVEVGPQLRSLRSPAFRAGLERVRRR
jgi:enoyl-CoA hydratase